jgi:hypothetical protein
MVTRGPHWKRSVAMMKLMTQITTVILALVLALPTIGCQEKGRERESERDRVSEKGKESEREKPLDVQVDAGPVKVKVEGSKKPDEKDRHLDVEVEHHQGQDSGDRNK